jgi:hypothetical protein
MSLHITAKEVDIYGMYLVVNSSIPNMSTK